MAHLRFGIPVQPRALLQHFMAWGLPILVLGGLFYPRLGLIAGAMMLTSLVISYWKNRWWCGWMCPRGSFLERWLRFVSFNRPIPRLLVKPQIRWTIFSFLMTVMLVRVAFAGQSLDRIGAVFIMLCLTTTVVAITLGVSFKARTWCTICPMGTLQTEIGKLRR